MNGLNIQELIALVLDELRGMWRYRWWANLTSWLILAVAWFYVSSLPDVYRASTRVFVDTSSLLTPLMRGLTAPTNTLDQVQLVTRSVLTRPNLTEVAYKTDLALEAETPEALEAVVTSLQNQIQIGGGRDNVFTITYEHRDRERALAVVTAVLDKLIETTLGNTGDDTEITERALKNEIEVHERRLREAETTLAQFKHDNLGYMPNAQGDYYNRLQEALTRVQQTEEQMRLAIGRRDELLRQLEGEEPVFGIMPVEQTNSACPQSARITELETQLVSFLLEYTDRHPRVTSLRETIEQLRDECAAATPPTVSFGATASSAAPLESNLVYQNLRLLLSQVELELSDLRAQLTLQQQEVAQLRSDVDRMTQVETQLKQLNRDYNVIQDRHQELLKRWEELQARKRLDQVADTVQFRRIEPPFALADPVGPNRSLLLLGGLIAALCAGAALAFGLSQLHPVFFTKAQLRRTVGLPILGSVSLLLSPRAALRRRLGMVAWGAACMALLACTALAILFADESAALVRSLGA